MTTKFYLDFRGRAADGKGSLLITIAHNNSVTTVSTGIRLSHNEWDGEKIVNRHDSIGLNAIINKKKSDLDLSIAFLSAREDFPYMTASQVKKAVVKKSDITYDSDSRMMSVLFNEYMNTDIREGTKAIYRATLDKVLVYGGERCTINDIDYKWLTGFEMFLAKTQGVNGRGIYLRALRAICNYAKKIKVTHEYAFESFSVRAEETMKRSVPVETLRAFHDFEVTESIERYRDYFFLMFYLIGINIGDLIKLTKDSIVKDRLVYVRSKTHKVYSIKLEPEAKELIRKYRGKNFLLDALDTCQHIKSFMHMLNNALKTIGPTSYEMVPSSDDLFAPYKQEKVIKPIIPDCSTYYARHCWATYAGEIGIPIDVISNALGHPIGNRTTLIYIKFNSDEVDKANRKVIDYFLNK